MSDKSEAKAEAEAEEARQAQTHPEPEPQPPAEVPPMTDAEREAAIAEQERQAELGVAKCGATYPELTCTEEPGHKGNHSDGEVTWPQEDKA